MCTPLEAEQIQQAISTGCMSYDRMHQLLLRQKGWTQSDALQHLQRDNITVGEIKYQKVGNEFFTTDAINALSPYIATLLGNP